MREQIEALFSKQGPYDTADFELFDRFKEQLNSGAIRAAEPDSSEPTGWRVNAWVKQGIISGFRMGHIADMSIDGGKLPFFDKSTFPLQALTVQSGVRLVPGGSSIRDGVHVARGVNCIPPMFINVGAYVGAGTMVDSHALIGSCAQVGARVHISAASQIGGVLEPVGALPVIIEDDVLVGGNCGVYEGTVVKKRAVIGTGTILNGSTPVYDLPRNTVHRAENGQPLVIPEEAVVVAGSRAVSTEPGKSWGISLYTPVIVKYRDSKTDAKVQLEDFLR